MNDELEMPMWIGHLEAHIAARQALPKCPKCGGQMEDLRYRKMWHEADMRNPDLRCEKFDWVWSDEFTGNRGSCDGLIWSYEK